MIQYDPFASGHEPATDKPAERRYVRVHYESTEIDERTFRQTEQQHRK